MNLDRILGEMDTVASPCGQHLPSASPRVGCATARISAKSRISPAPSCAHPRRVHRNLAIRQRGGRRVGRLSPNYSGTTRPIGLLPSPSPARWISRFIFQPECLPPKRHQPDQGEIPMAQLQKGGPIALPTLSHPSPSSPHRAARTFRLRRLGKHTILYLIAIPILLLMILPYLYMLMQSLAPWDQVD